MIASCVFLVLFFFFNLFLKSSLLSLWSVGRGKITDEQVAGEK